MNKLITIIIPVYNEEKHISECIGSVLNQSYKNIEIILVDDGSTDNSGLICDEHSKLDSRIKIFHKKHEGVSSARNLGLDHATGEYIYFLDSDDIISVNAIKLLSDGICNNDMSFGRHVTLDIKNRKKYVWNYPYRSNQVLSKDDALLLMFDSSALHGINNRCQYISYCYNKLFKMSIIEANNIRFDPDVFYNEDRLFVIEYLLKCTSVIFINFITYKYMCYKGDGKFVNILNEYRDFNKEITELPAFEKMISKLDSGVIRNSCIYTAYKRSIRLYIKYIFDDKYNKKCIVKYMKHFSHLLLVNKDEYKMFHIIFARLINMFL